MPAGNSARPGKWENAINLYDDDDYSAIWGNYDGSSERCLGVRWNGEELGYPSQGGNPLWYVEPTFLTKNILLELLHKVNNDSQLGNMTNILLALKEHR